MPYKEKEIKKLYYSIGEVSEMLSINASTIRYWEGEFPTLKPRKNRKGDRLFTDKDIDLIRVIHELVKEKGYTVDGARNHLQKHKSDSINRMQAIRKLEEMKNKIISFKDSL